MSLAQCVSLILVVLVFNVHSANILGVFTAPSVSHQIVFQPIWRELSLRGHQVTVLTPNPLNDPSLTNLTEIDLGFLYKKLEEFKEEASKGMNHWAMMDIFLNVFFPITTQLYLQDEVQNFIKDSTQSFDVVLAEVIDPLTFAFAGKFKCPLIGVASLSVTNTVHEEIGTPVHPVLHPDLLTPYYGGDLRFLERIDAVLFDLYERYFYKYKYLPAANSVAKKYFGEHLPDLQSLLKNMSMIFLNTNSAIHGVRPYGPNVIEIGGGIHIKPSKPLPSELKTFLDNATEGVIYFSLGTNVKSIYLPENIRNIFIRIFDKLPYKVLWKFEDDQLEGKPENVKINKWLPQQDVLRHPNIKLFITQAGLQSTEEALLNGVPLLAIPFAGDQSFNAKSIEKLEVGLRLDIRTLTQENLLSSISEILENPKYRKRALDVGNLINDQPMTGLEKAIWWTEYVIRNQGAPCLRNPRADITWSEFLILDVVAFLFSIFIIALFVLYKIGQFFVGFVFKSKQSLKKKLK